MPKVDPFRLHHNRNLQKIVKFGHFFYCNYFTSTHWDGRPIYVHCLLLATATTIAAAASRTEFNEQIEEEKEGKGNGKFREHFHEYGMAKFPLLGPNK